MFPQHYQIQTKLQSPEKAIKRENTYETRPHFTALIIRFAIACTRDTTQVLVNLCAQNNCISSTMGCCASFSNCLRWNLANCQIIKVWKIAIWSRNKKQETRPDESFWLSNLTDYATKCTLLWFHLLISESDFSNICLFGWLPAVLPLIDYTAVWVPPPRSARWYPSSFWPCQTRLMMDQLQIWKEEEEEEETMKSCRWLLPAPLIKLNVATASLSI